MVIRKEDLPNQVWRMEVIQRHLPVCNVCLWCPRLNPHSSQDARDTDLRFPYLQKPIYHGHGHGKVCNNAILQTNTTLSISLTKQTSVCFWIDLLKIILYRCYEAMESRDSHCLLPGAWSSPAMMTSLHTYLMPIGWELQQPWEML